MELEEVDKNEFTPRSYQSEILEIAVKENTIIYLPTGSGKTFIAIMLINRLSHAIVKPSTKKTVMLVNTVPLVEQHYFSIKRHTDVEVGRFSGDLNVDLWSADQWESQLSKYQVIILTAQIFLDIILHGYFSLERVNLLVFDECHQAVEKQPMRQIMKLFENVPLDRQPRVLGLTATLLNGNCSPSKVKEVVRSLETTFQSKVATVRKLAHVLGYATNPQEKIQYFVANPPGDVLASAIRMVLELSEFVSSVRYSKPADAPSSLRLKPLQQTQNETKELTKLLKTLVLHMEMFGVFGGWKGAFACLVSAERLRRHAEDKLTDTILTAITTTLSAVMAMLEHTMAGYTTEQCIFKFSSHQVLMLVETLREYRKQHDNLAGIVFVKQRFTAKVLYYVLRALAESSAEFGYLRCDFMIGFNAKPADRDTRETFYAAKVNRRIVRSFHDGEINLLIASNVVEEGIDIPRCTLVIKFDRPMDYRSYIQSKGRARHGDSWYRIMVPNTERHKYLTSYGIYKDVESILQNYLVGKTHERQAPTRHEIEAELYQDQDVAPYYVDGPDSAHVTAMSAIQLVNRYCQSLHRDRFAVLTPNWFLKTVDGKFSVVIEMPIVCPLREPIEGPPMYTKNAAKRVAALEVCKLLHGLGELNKNLLPVTESEDPETFDYLFSHWLKEDAEPAPQPDAETNGNRSEEKRPAQPKPGTKKFIRQHQIHVPSFLTRQRSSRPADAQYLHSITFTPVGSGARDSAMSLDAMLLDGTLRYALITKDPLPPLCAFPIFISSGELRVDIGVNHKVVHLSHDDILALRAFNEFILNRLLRIMKDFLIFDNGEDASMLLIAPVQVFSGDPATNVTDYELDMGIVRDYTRIKPVDEPSLQDKLKLRVTEESYKHKVVWPWYRMSEAPYIVTKVCTNLTALSPFPSTGYSTYAAYYKDKYNIVLKNPTQPLLLVKGISKRLNCIRPRSATLHGAKRKKQDMMDGFEEHLVPELCVLQDFPAQLWYASGLLPTVMYRVVCLLQAESLRASIVRGTAIGQLDIDELNRTRPILVDERVFDTGEQKIQPVEQRNVDGADASALALPPAAAALNTKPKPLTNKDYSAKMLEKQYPWTDEQEPIDVERHLEALTLVEIEYFERFVNTPLTYDEVDRTEVNFRIANNKFPALTLEEKYEAQPIYMLRHNDNDCGPPLCDIFQCLMSAKANDVQNLERLETLGDSFLKLSVSLYLIMRYPKFNEGRLTHIKGKMIGNRNLLYCGLQRNLGGYIKVSEFQPRTEWLPPGLIVPRHLQQKIAGRELSVNKLFEFCMPLAEQISGEIGDDTVRDIDDMAQEFVAESEQDSGPEGVTTMNRFLGSQHVSDKTVSDCVEALIGAYLQSSGPEAALAMLGWFGILPANADHKRLFNQQPPPPAIHDRITQEQIDYHIPNYAQLEEHLGYKFRNRAYLLQALTHASYSTNRLTDCYQRLEFLGDAVLDFLITCHIYEGSDPFDSTAQRTVVGLTPGELTDLRSALVNNVTFAGLTVRNNFHAHLKHANTKLMDIIDTFVKFQEERDFVINEEVLILTEDDPLYMAEHVNVPKALGDLFESLAGAVFLDTGMDLQKTWLVFHKLMWREIEKFRRNVPKSPVRMLFESVAAAPKFGEANLMDNGITVVPCSVMVNGKKHKVHGFGDTKVLAKRAAAKLALRLIQCG